MNVAWRKNSLVMLTSALLAFLVSSMATPAHAESNASESSPAFRPNAETNLSALQALVRTRSPGVESARREVEIASAGVKKSELLPNPSLDAAWGTIPIGPTNPTNLPSPMTQVPNYSLGLSYTFPLGKRQPWKDRARALEKAAKADLDGDVRDRTIALAHALGVVATTTLRLQGLRRIAEQGHKEADVGQARFAANFSSELDVERLRIEAQRLDQSVLSAESDLRAALSLCTTTLGTPCVSFEDAQAARQFLRKWIDAASSGGNIETRPDIRALDARIAAAGAETRWARAQAIPDPTIRIGYVRDQFLVSGNQLNSLSLSVSMPLPLFDHGQAEVMAAQAARRGFVAEKEKTIEGSRSRRTILAERLDAQKKRQRTVTEEMLPRAERALQDVTRAVEARLLASMDVIQAQRTVSELVVAEADSFQDAFDAALEITSEYVTKEEEKQ